MCIPVKILTFNKKEKKKVFQLGPSLRSGSQLLREHSKFGATPRFAIFAAWHFAVLQEPGAFSRLFTSRKLRLANLFSLKCDGMRLHSFKYLGWSEAYKEPTTASNLILIAELHNILSL